MVGQLYGVMSVPTSPEGHRLLSSVLLRRLVEPKHKRLAEEQVWNQLPAEVRAHLKAGLITTLAGEPKRHLRHKVAHVIAQLSVLAAGVGGCEWPELLPGIMALTQNADAALRETGVFALACLAEYFGNEALSTHAAHLQGVLATLLADSDMTVKMRALEATTVVILSTFEDEARAHYYPLVPQLMGVLGETLMVDEFAAREGLMSFIKLLQGNALFLRTSADVAASAMLSICGNTEFEDE
jgi:hypothetical protein